MQNLKRFKGIHSSELRGFFTGLILGGGMIDNGVHNRALVIRSINRDFIDMIADIITNNTPFKYTIHTHDERIDNIHYRLYWLLRINAHPYFAKLYHYFYDDYRHRIISCKALNWLNPIGLACWYMSDGYVCLLGKTKGVIRHRRVDICTNRYNCTDIQLAVDRLSEFGIKATIIKQERFHRIRIKKESYETFINLIKDYIVPSMQYKLYLGYTEQPKWMSNESWEYQQYLSSAITQTDNAVG